MAEPDRPELSADDCVRIFHEALVAGDVRGVEAALTVLAVRDARRAQELYDEMALALALARTEEAKTR